MEGPQNLRLSANPGYYDYVHSIEFKSDNSCIFWDGGGQVMSLELEGKYIMTPRGVIFTLGNQHFEVPYAVEQGPFLLPQEAVWNIPTVGDLSFWIFPRRFVFTHDPFQNIYQRQGNLYFAIEEPESELSLRQFYIRTEGRRVHVKNMTPEELTLLQKHAPEIHNEFLETK